jgi:hypothetical protein
MPQQSYKTIGTRVSAAQYSLIEQLQQIEHRSISSLVRYLLLERARERGLESKESADRCCARMGDE